MDVAKVWYSDDNLKRTKLGISCRIIMNWMTNCEMYIPWWVEEGQKEIFCLADEYKRVLIHCYEMLKCDSDNNVFDDMILVKYENLVTHPDEILRKLSEKNEIVETIHTFAVKSKFMIS